MMGKSHRLAGTAAWLGAAPALGVHGWQWAAGALIAGATSHGRMSPDADIYPILGKLIPGGHRGWTHWWPWPLLMYALAPLLGRWAWVLLAVAVAWESHVLTDAVFGRVPVWPRARKGHRSRWRYAGIGLNTGGLVEKLVAVPVFTVAAGWFLWTALLPT